MTRYCDKCESIIQESRVVPPETTILLIWRQQGRIHVARVQPPLAAAGVIAVEADWSETEADAALAFVKGELA
jgi:hypothetical protein